MNLNLTLACGLYDRTLALKTGAVKPEGIDLNFLVMTPAEIFRRQSRHTEFDVAEMSFSTYSILLGQEDYRMIAIPVFPSRKFRQSEIIINRNSKIETPKDLMGKRVGCSEYQQTAAVWIRGQLQHDYGVDLKKITWCFGGLNEPEHWSPRIPISIPSDYNIEILNNTQCLNEMLEKGEIDAVIGANLPKAFLNGSSNLDRLFPDYQAVETAYYQRTKIFPIMHIVVIKREVYEKAPWTAMNLYSGFDKSKTYGTQLMDRVPSTLFASLPWLMEHMESTTELMGPDPFKYGLDSQNRNNIETLLLYNYEQGLVPKRLSIEEFFAPETHHLT